MKRNKHSAIYYIQIDLGTGYTKLIDKFNLRIRTRQFVGHYRASEYVIRALSKFNLRTHPNKHGYYYEQGIIVGTTITYVVYHAPEIVMYEETGTFSKISENVDEWLRLSKSYGLSLMDPKRSFQCTVTM